MSLDEKLAAKRFNEQQKVIASFNEKGSLAFFAGTISIWYGDPSVSLTYVVLGLLAGLSMLSFAIAAPMFMKSED